MDQNTNTTHIIRITLTNPTIGEWTAPGADHESTVPVAGDVTVPDDNDLQKLADRLRPHVIAYLDRHHLDAKRDTGVYVSAWDPHATHLGEPVPGGKELCSFRFRAGGEPLVEDDVNTTREVL